VSKRPGVIGWAKGIFLGKKFKPVASLVTILMVLIAITGLLVLAAPRSSFAISVDSGNCGLTVETPGDPVDVSNLNPGDTKSSYLIVHNSKDTPFNYFFDIVKTGSTAGQYPGLEGKHLDEIMIFTIERGGLILFQGLLSQFNELNMGTLSGNANQRIDVTVHFPPDAGNEYQGAGVSVLFKLRSVCTPEEEGVPPADTVTPPAPPGTPVVISPPEDIDTVTPPADPDITPPPDDDVIVIPPDDPAVTPPPDEEITVDPEWPKLPPTGELLSYMFYAAGALLLAGLLLGKKRRLDRK